VTGGVETRPTLGSCDEVLAGYADATQTQMELEAMIQRLKMATGRDAAIDPPRDQKIVITTDSTYIANNFGAAVSVWPKEFGEVDKPVA